jgi:hypothetical protein
MRKEKGNSGKYRRGKRSEKNKFGKYKREGKLEMGNNLKHWLQLLDDNPLQVVKNLEFL